MCGAGKLVEFDPFVPEGAGVRALVDLKTDQLFLR